MAKKAQKPDAVELLEGQGSWLRAGDNSLCLEWLGAWLSSKSEDLVLKTKVWGGTLCGNVILG